jgi:epoxyqueuosine reductase
MKNHTLAIKQASKAAGFDHCGIARAEALDEDARRLEAWLKQGMQGGMHYMERHFDLRIDPRKLVPGARSVITLLKNYYQPHQQPPHAPRVSKYAYGEDYHQVIREKLNALYAQLQGDLGRFAARGFVDSAPVLERSWASKAGLGWVGKNGNLLTKSGGSFFFIATLITDLNLEPDLPFTRDFCGTCTRCIDACPTAAILPDKVVDGSKCISYFTIELKELLMPDNTPQHFENWAFGCDTCQDVCPWNRFSTPTEERRFRPLPEIVEWNGENWESMTEEVFKKVFRNSAISRARFAGIRRNLQFIRQKPRERCAEK